MTNSSLQETFKEVLVTYTLEVEFIFQLNSLVFQQRPHLSN